MEKTVKDYEDLLKDVRAALLLMDFDVPDMNRIGARIYAEKITKFLGDVPVESLYEGN